MRTMFFPPPFYKILRPDIQVTRGLSLCPDGLRRHRLRVGGRYVRPPLRARECRPNGVPYAAFGLLWRLLGAQLVGEHQARLLDENFIQPLDLNDNTGEQNSLADAIGSFNPLWDSKDDPDVCFWRAVPVAKQILENEIAAANAVNRADDTVRRAYASMKDGIVVLPAYMPWKTACTDRRGLCRLPQPARRLQCAVRQRPPHQAQQAAVPGGLGRQARGQAARGQRPGPAVLPPQPVPDHRPMTRRRPSRHAAARCVPRGRRSARNERSRTDSLWPVPQPRRGAGADPRARLGLPAALPGWQPVRRLDERSGPPLKSPPQRQGRGQVHKKPWQGRRPPGLRREMRR